MAAVNCKAIAALGRDSMNRQGCDLQSLQHFVLACLSSAAYLASLAWKALAA